MTTYTIKWPGSLTIWDMNRLVRARRTCSIPDELGRLAGKGIQMTPEEAYGLIDQIMELWKHLGFYPLDAGKNSEEWTDDDELPVCALATTEAQYIDYRDMPRILALHDGANLPDSMSEEERQMRIRRQRRRPVLTTTCRHEGCDERIVITVGVAARAIRAHLLIELGDIYEPSTLCKRHRAERDEMLSQKRSKTGLRVSFKQAARWSRNSEEKKEKEEKGEDNVDSNVAITPPVTESQEFLSGEEAIRLLEDSLTTD